ncbi:MAG: tRNA 2-selenouridine(34) synthase MnmH [Pseudorhodobacter sp.]
MALSLTSLTQIVDAGYDDIIDVRAPAEFAEDHLPGAINLPVLNDDERARVGTIYKQDSPFRARKIGGALVAANAARHLQGPLADKPGSWRPLVYCWRGGQRSGSFASILSQVGWRVELVAGGYKAWRGLVVDALYERPFPGRLVVLDGNTGSAKTEVLNQLPAYGIAVLDLEGHARHRGSVFGAQEGGQPSQKAFEGGLALAMARLEAGETVVVEAESSRIGRCRLPPGLWRAMTEAPRIVIRAPLEARAAYLVRAYADLRADPEQLQLAIGWLRGQHSNEVLDRWQAMARAQSFAPLAQDLMERHYDPRYAKHRARFARATDREVFAETLQPDALNKLAERVATEIRAFMPR